MADRLSAPNSEMYGQDSSQEAGRQFINNTGGNSEPRGIPHNYHASRTYYSPFGHPDLEYVYQVSSIQRPIGDALKQYVE